MKMRKVLIAMADMSKKSAVKAAGAASQYNYYQTEEPKALKAMVEKKNSK